MVDFMPDKKGLQVKEEETIEDDNLSVLSVTSTDSIDDEKFKLKGQYTCDECPLIPKIISTDVRTRTINLKCELHGLKTIDINSYINNSMNFNTLNWKCSKCKNIQRKFLKMKFKVENNWLVRTEEDIELNPKDFVHCSTIEELNDEIHDYIHNKMQFPELISEMILL